MTTTDLARTASLLARLAGMKNRWDPDNIFKLNQNIPPSPHSPGTCATAA